MNTVCVSVFDPSYHDLAQANKHGLRDAFAAHGTVIELDYVRLDNRERCIQEAVDGLRADLLWMQSAETFTPDFLRSLHAAHPALKIVNWCGDPWLSVLTSERMLASAKAVDCQLVVNGAALKRYDEEGIRAYLWPHSFEPIDEKALPDVPEYEVVFLGNCRNEYRQALERILTALPCRVGIYGAGWQAAQGECMYNFAYGYALYQKAKIAISDNEFKDGLSYLSDRPFQALNAGCLVFQQWGNGLETIGFEDGRHWITFEALSDIPALVNYWLTADRRAPIAEEGQREVRLRHSWSQRVGQLLAILETETV